MKRFIPFAFATLAMPLMSMAQTSAPPPDEEKPPVPKVPVPVPETVVPAPPPAVPAEATPAQPDAAVPDKPEKPATSRGDRPGPPEAERPSAPGSKRRGPPGGKDPTGAPEAPTQAGGAPEGRPSTKPERAAPPAGADRPSGRPAETGDTPPANRGKGKGPGNRGKGAATRDTPPVIPETPGTPPATPETPGAPPATPGMPPAATSTPPATTSETRPRPGKRPTGPQERGGDPSAPPAPAPGAPMPAVTSTPEVPGEAKPAERPERPAAQQPPSQETAKVLEDEPKRDRQADAAQARKIDNKDDAKRLLLNILGGAAAAAVGVDPNDRRAPSDRRDSDPRRRRDGFRHGYRPSFEEVGRTQQDRERAVSTIVERFQGRVPQAAPPGSHHREQRIFQTTETQRRTQFYDGNRRVIRYSSMQEIPPIIVASQRLNRVQLQPQAQSTYRVRPQPAPQQGQRLYQNEIPPSYTNNDAYAVSYQVDPDSAISTDAILFRQGSTDFADAYSYDLVIDMANAMQAPALSNQTFVIEGHASAEGDYGQNLQLSQERAERISRELVRHGVSAERLMPVGYGEAEAAYPANANEADRSLDRRVVVFRMR